MHDGFGFFIAGFGHSKSSINPIMSMKSKHGGFDIGWGIEGGSFVCRLNDEVVKRGKV